LFFVYTLKLLRDPLTIGVARGHGHQGCEVGPGAGVGVVRSRRFLSGVGVEFLTTLGAGVAVHHDFH